MDELDPEDIARCQRGERRGLEAAFAVYGDRVFRLCLHLLGQRADAEDAAQEVFLRIQAKAASFAGRSRFSTWIHRLTVNHCQNRRRRDRRRPPSLDVQGLDEARLPACPRPSPAQAAQQQDALLALLARLDDDARAVLVLREIEGLSYREVAALLRIPEGTVMSRLSRARDKLARALASGRAVDARAPMHASARCSGRVTMPLAPADHPAPLPHPTDIAPENGDPDSKLLQQRLA